MTLTKLDLQKIATLLALTEDRLEKKMEEKISNLATKEEFDFLRDEILTELRKVRVEQVSVHSKVYKNLEPRIEALEDNN